MFIGCSLALTLSMLDQTIVATLIPTLAKDFNAGRSSSWIATAYLLSSTAFQPVTGRCSDIFGRKRALLVAIAVFFIGSLASSVAQNINELIVFRSISGLGGGAILSLILIVMSDVVSLRDRSRYAGYLGLVITVANGIGPVVGGVIGEKSTWRLAFWIYLPLCGIAFLMIALYLPLKHVKGSAKKEAQTSRLARVLHRLCCISIDSIGTAMGPVNLILGNRLMFSLL